eukprot:g2140.t1
MSTMLSSSNKLPDGRSAIDKYDSSPLLFRLIPYLMKIYKYNEVVQCTLMKCLQRYNNYIGYKELYGKTELLFDEQRNTFLHRLLLYDDLSFELVNKYLQAIAGKDSNKFMKMILQENLNGETPLQIAVKRRRNKIMWQMLEILKEEMDSLRNPPSYHQDEKYSSRIFQKAWVKRLRLVHAATKYANVDLILQFIAMGCSFNIECEYRLGPDSDNTENLSPFDLLFFPPDKVTEEDRCARISILEYILASPLFIPLCKYENAAPEMKYETKYDIPYPKLMEKYKGIYRNRKMVLDICLGIKWNKKKTLNELKEYLIQLFQMHDAWESLYELHANQTQGNKNELMEFVSSFLGKKRVKIKNKFEKQFVEKFVKLRVPKRRNVSTNVNTKRNHEEYCMRRFTNHFIDTFVHEFYAIVKAVDQNLLRKNETDAVVKQAVSYLKPLPLMLGLGTRNQAICNNVLDVAKVLYTYYRGLKIKEEDKLDSRFLYLFDHLSIGKLAKVIEHGAKSLCERYKELIINMNDEDIDKLSCELVLRVARYIENKESNVVRSIYKQESFQEANMEGETHWISSGWEEIKSQIGRFAYNAFHGKNAPNYQRYTRPIEIIFCGAAKVNFDKSSKRRSQITFKSRSIDLWSAIENSAVLCKDGTVFVCDPQNPHLNLNNGIRIGTTEFAKSLGFKEISKEDREENSQNLNTRIDVLLSEFQFVNKDNKSNAMSTEQGKLRIDIARAYLSTNLHSHIYSRDDLSNIMMGLTDDPSEIDKQVAKLLGKEGYFDRFVDAFVSCFFKEGYFLISALDSGHVIEKDGPFENWLKSAIKILDGVEPIMENEKLGTIGTAEQREKATAFALKFKLGLTFVNSVWNFYKDKKKSMQCDQFFEFFDRNIMSFCDTVNIVTALAEHIFVKYHDSIDRVKEEHVGQVARQACLRFLSYILNTQNVKKFKTNRENISKCFVRKLTNWTYNRHRLPPRERLENLVVVIEDGVRWGNAYSSKELKISLDNNNIVNCLDIFTRPDVMVFDRGMVLNYWENTQDKHIFGYMLSNNVNEGKDLGFKDNRSEKTKYVNITEKNAPVNQNSSELITCSSCKHFENFLFKHAGDKAYANGDYRDAIAIFLKWKKKLLEMNDGNENCVDLMKVFVKLGDVYEKQGEYNTSMEYLEKALPMQVKEFGTEEHVDVGKTYARMGWTSQWIGKYDQAMKYCMKSLKIRLKVLDEGH